MKKSKIILLCKLLFIVISLIVINVKVKNYHSKYNLNDNQINGTIVDINYTNNKTKIVVKGLEKILIVFNDMIDVSLGDYIEVNGTITIPNKNTNFYTFNYQNYLLSKGINFVMYADNYILKKNNKWYYKIKQSIINNIDKNVNSSYLKAFVLADTSDIDTSIYRKIGISHLFAISGMHVTFITFILDKILKKILKKDFIVNIIISIFLMFYMFIVSFSISVVRASLMYILIKINKALKINLKIYEILILIFLSILVINPFIIYNISFLFSFTISFYLIIFSDLINRGCNYLVKLLLISFISFVASFPIVVNNFHEVNFMSIIFNLLFVPFFTFLIFPLALISMFMPFIKPIFDVFINIFNYLSLLCSNMTILKFSFAHINIYGYIFYYVLITLLLYSIYKKKYKIILCFIIVLIIHYNISLFDFNNSITFFDVGQGDSLFIKFKNNKGNILIDTGGNNTYEISINVIIPYLKSVGIHSLDYLIITHGDADHMGEAINLVENFKVEKVIFNCGEYNELEQELIKILDKKKIPYYLCIKELNIGNNKLNFLQTIEYDNENDNSNVIYTEIDGYKFMFMGDAGVEKEKDILDKYNISNIDVLKVGHHGSKTSSSETFIDEINPKYSIISVGKNNRYGHPNKEVLENLDNSKIYKTDKNGSIMLKIKNNKLKIETCSL